MKLLDKLIILKNYTFFTLLLLIFKMVYSFLNEEDLQINWALVLTASILYFSYEKIPLLRDKKGKYISLFVLGYLYAKFLRNSIFYIHLNLLTSVTLLLLFILLLLFLNYRIKNIQV